MAKSENMAEENIVAEMAENNGIISLRNGEKQLGVMAKMAAAKAGIIS
jgi:hypothetical protein